MKLNLKIGARILAGYALALLSVGIVGLVMYRAMDELVDSANWVAHTHRVKETIAAVLSTLRDAETETTWARSSKLSEAKTATPPTVDTRGGAP